MSFRLSATTARQLLDASTGKWKICECCDGPGPVVLSRPVYRCCGFPPGPGTLAGYASDAVDPGYYDCAAVPANPYFHNAGGCPVYIPAVDPVNHGSGVGDEWLTPRAEPGPCSGIIIDLLGLDASRCTTCWGNSPPLPPASSHYAALAVDGTYDLGLPSCLPIYDNNVGVNIGRLVTVQEYASRDCTGPVVFSWSGDLNIITVFADCRLATIVEVAVAGPVGSGYEGSIMVFRWTGSSPTTSAAWLNNGLAACVLIGHMSAANVAATGGQARVRFG